LRLESLMRTPRTGIGVRHNNGVLGRGWAKCEQQGYSSRKERGREVHDNQYLSEADGFQTERVEARQPPVEKSTTPLVFRAEEFHARTAT